MLHRLRQRSYATILIKEILRSRQRIIKLTFKSEIRYAARRKSGNRSTYPDLYLPPKGDLRFCLC